MTRVFFAIAACAVMLSFAQPSIKVPVPTGGIVLLADDGGPLPPPCEPDLPPNA
jgi:hypothetical protein